MKRAQARRRPSVEGYHQRLLTGKSRTILALNPLWEQLPNPLVNSAEANPCPAP